MVLSARQIGQKINEVRRSEVEVKVNQRKSEQPSVRSYQIRSECGREIEWKVHGPG